MANVNEENDPGMLIFEDVFRRADKNDVGAVSWDNFMSFFADGVMGKDELRHLFDEIDTHNTNNIDCGELCSYFSKHLGPFREIYSRVGELNRVVSDALLKTSGVYPASSREDKFVTRFLIREILNQFSSLQRPLEAAAEILDDQARQERPDVLPLGLDQVTKKDNSTIIPGRVVRRAKRQISSQSSTTESTGSLALQVERLEALLDRFEHRVNFEGTAEEEIIDKEDPGSDNQVLLVKRTLLVKPDQGTDFRQELHGYITNTQKQDGCLFVSIRLYKDTNKFILYEMWNSDDQRKMYESGGPVAVVTDPNHPLLAAPPDTSTMAIPGQWWRK